MSEFNCLPNERNLFKATARSFGAALAFMFLTPIPIDAQCNMGYSPQEVVYSATEVEKAMDIVTRLRFVNVTSIEAFIKDMKSQKGFNATNVIADLNFIKQNLPQVLSKIENDKSETVIAQAQAILDKQRKILMLNPLLDMDKILVSRFVLGDQARTGTTNKMCMPMSNYMGIIDVPPSGYDARISLLSTLRNEMPTEKILYKPTRGEGIADLQLHWNGDKFLFAKPHPIVLDAFYNQEYPQWNIFEMDIEGKQLNRVTQFTEPDLEFGDPCYLPDGRILFTTNIGYNGIPCEHGERVIMNLAIHDPKDKSTRKLTFDQDGNWSPTVLNNGRIMYTRWEYTDLTHYYTRIVMHSNPDGTDTRALYGSGSFWPTSVYDMQQIPGSVNQFIGIVSGHHGIPRSGQLVVFDPSKGRKEADGVIQEIPFSQRKVVPVMKDRLVDGVWPQFSRPFPLNDKYFLVTAKLHSKGLWGIYLVDMFDNVTLVAETEGSGYLTPIPVAKRAVPQVIPDRIVKDEKEATVFIQDLYEGEGLRKLPKGVVKKLRVFTYEYAYIKSPSDFDALGVQSGWDLKRELGVVDVEEDGSAIFKVPANTPISLQPLDENGNAIQWMRSWFTAMPGEVLSCVGCHENQNMIPIPKRTIASQKQPNIITAPKGGVRPFSFELEIQPILDKYCISCHDGESGMDLTSNVKKEYKRWGNYITHRFMNMSYYNIHPYVYRQGPEADLAVLRPYEYHPSNSELIQMIQKGHHGVDINKEDMNTLYHWIDFNAPYFGDFEIAGRYKATFEQYPRRQQLMQKYANVSVDWKKELEDYAAYLKTNPQQPVAPKIVETKEVDMRKVSSWSFDVTKAKQMQQQSSSATEKSIEIAPGLTMKMVWIPSGKYMKGKDVGTKQPVDFKEVNIKRGFWMGSLEVSNEQYCALVPDHDSRYIGEQWKDHTIPGLPANRPEQPVVRVSWEEAMAYCKLLSEKSGMKITLPSEEQWEWACRAGSATDMWFGDITTDYSKFENMADFTIKDLAVWGLDPTTPMPDNQRVREYWDYVPRDRNSNDGSLISVKGGMYAANPWGLHDMHGNVSEWTVSDAVGNMYYEGDKVVCGGSWHDRAAKSTAFFRRYFKPWQAPYNVGFRIIAQD